MVDQQPSPPLPTVVPWCDRDRTSSYTAERIQLALALADTAVLRTLLSTCTPTIVPAARLGAISTRVSVPAGELVADGLITFEAIHCTLATVGLNPPVDAFAERPYSLRCRYETPLRTLVNSVTLEQAALVLHQAQIPADQVQAILKLPRQGWHKSWWYAHRSPLPFQRYIRCRRYGDGTVTLQYKDYFEREQPPCFHSQRQQALVIIQPNPQPFGQTLAELNRLRQRLGAAWVVLITSDLKATAIEAFIRQNISLYPVVTLANPINCSICSCGDCPLQGQTNSPVTGCDRFLPSYG